MVIKYRMSKIRRGERKRVELRRRIKDDLITAIEWMVEVLDREKMTRAPH